MQNFEDTTSAPSLDVRFAMDNGCLVSFPPLKGVPAERFWLGPAGISELMEYLKPESEVPEESGGSFSLHFIGTHALVEGPVAKLFPHLSQTDTSYYRGINDISGSYTYTPKSEVKVFGLVEGGWLPLNLTRAQVIFPDSNVAKMLSRDPIKVLRVGGLPDELSLLEQTGTLIHPAIAGLEGNRRDFPDQKTIEQEMRSVSDRLFLAMQAVRGRMRVASVDVEMCEKVQKLVEGRKERYPRESEFLKKFAPRVQNVVPAEEKIRVFNELCKCANEYDVGKHSFLFMLLADCVYDMSRTKKLKQPGRALIKPSANYSDGDAYNALFDIFLMEFLVLQHQAFVGKIAVVTGDLGLVKAWALFRPRDFHLSSIKIDVPDYLESLSY